MNSLKIRSHKTLLPADYIGTLGGGLLPEMFNSINQYDTEQHHVIELALPGMNSHDIKVELKNPVLWIIAQRTVKNPVSGKREIRGLPYQRSFIVPRNCDADSVTAKCRDGLLTIKIKKAKRKAPFRIEVTGPQAEGINWLRKLHQRAASLFN